MDWFILHTPIRDFQSSTWWLIHRSWNKVNASFHQGTVILSCGEWMQIKNWSSLNSWLYFDCCKLRRISISLECPYEPQLLDSEKYLSVECCFVACWVFCPAESRFLLKNTQHATVIYSTVKYCLLDMSPFHDPCHKKSWKLTRLGTKLITSLRIITHWVISPRLCFFFTFERFFPVSVHSFATCEISTLLILSSENGSRNWIVCTRFQKSRGKQTTMSTHW